jgi:alanyl-tRNA synthetase
MNAQEIRARYLRFFAEKDHAILPSASLIPENDPTVLFNTAGMQPLVPYLMGESHPQGKRLVSAQKCIRTNDIDEVGDNRHLTFFEMLGNWSLGDYFKDQSIRWSWEFLTSKEYGLGLDPNRLYVTVFTGDKDAPRDQESIGLWEECFHGVGLEAKIDTPLSEGGRIFPLSKESNWWPPTDNPGPCGPDTEIFYDIQDEQFPLTLPDGRPDLEGGRFIEVWNNVFMTFNKTATGALEPLSQNNVDTGMGLERITMVIQGVPTVYDTDLFVPIIFKLKELTGQDNHYVRIMADHLKASTMLISDGVLPSNKDRGYVLRRLIRRAVFHSQQEDTAWIPVIVDVIAGIYQDAYPAVWATRTEIAQSISEEVAKFQRTIAKGKVEIAKREHLTGKDAFDLYQSYGFPLELTKEYALQRGISLDESEFEMEFKKHQDLSRTASAGQFSSGLADHSDQVIKYHTATHLLHQALREVLGTHVQQKGSNITAERLRFDFSHHEKMADEQIKRVENIVNAQIRAGLPVVTTTMSPEEAANQGYIGLFGHKYGDIVSTYAIGDFSKEICTGPHVKNTAELGEFHIQKEEAVSAGVRRIKAQLI